MTIWFITGTSSGFGRHLAELLLERGGRVAATSRKIEALDDLGRRYGDRLWKAALDVTNTAEVKRVVERAFADLGRIDVVFSNAGYNLVGGAEEVSDEQFMHLLATNLIGSIQVTRATLPRLRAQGGGRMLQLSSMGGHAAFPAAAIMPPANGGSRVSSRR
jgi:NADP-dependent 3-hydroxy acid dehydrogenase YdfG